MFLRFILARTDTHLALPAPLVNVFYLNMRSASASTLSASTASS